MNKFKREKKEERSGTISAYIPEHLIDFVKKNDINFSLFVREKLKELKKELEESKQDKPKKEV